LDVLCPRGVRVVGGFPSSSRIAQGIVQNLSTSQEHSLICQNAILDCVVSQGQKRQANLQNQERSKAGEEKNTNGSEVYFF
jgi:hypothetical protein